MNPTTRLKRIEVGGGYTCGNCREMKMSMRFFMLDNFLCFGGWVGAVTPAILAQG